MLRFMETKQEKNPLTNKLKRVVGARVLALREDRERAEGKFSQNDLAVVLQAMGQSVKQSQIGHIEAGRRLPSVELLYALAECFDTSLDFLAGRTKESSSIAAIEEDLQTGGISGRLGEMYKSLPAEKQAQVYEFAEALHIIEQKGKQARGMTAAQAEHQRRRANVFFILELVERNLGHDVRVELEKIIRDKWQFGDE